jgi:hypothetical protein
MIQEFFWFERTPASFCVRTVFGHYLIPTISRIPIFSFCFRKSYENKYDIIHLFSLHFISKYDSLHTILV